LLIANRNNAVQVYSPAKYPDANTLQTPSLYVDLASEAPAKPSTFMMPIPNSTINPSAKAEIQGNFRKQ
jgi:hypothetical protein